MKYNKKVFTIELIGIAVIVVLGFIFHELYEFTDNNFIVGLFTPVNESKWEHWKIAFLPVLITSLIEYPYIKDHVNNYIFSKAVGILAFFATTFGLIELYELLFGEGEMWLHITTFVLGAIVSQIVSYYIMTKSKPSSNLDQYGIIIIIVLLALFIIFTIKPPRTDYFRDSTDGTYGIYRETKIE